MKSCVLFVFFYFKNYFLRSSIVDKGSDFDVSITSHSDRVGRVFAAIESACSGSLKPRRILLFLSKEDWSGRLPSTLKRLCDRGLEIIECENVGPHKKHQPYLSMFTRFSLPLITLDDDVYYPSILFERLYSVWYWNPMEIHCSRARSVLLEDGKLAPYKKWPLCANKEASFRNFSTGVGGVIYPPDFLERLKDAGQEYKEKCPTADDVWINKTAVREGYKVRQLDSVSAVYTDIPGSRRTALFKKNVRRGGNDFQISSTYSSFEVDRMMS